MSEFQHRFARRTESVNPSVIREILKVVAQSDVISFAGGMPPPELFPTEDLKIALQRSLASPDRVIASLQYGASEGYEPLRRWIANSLKEEGIEVPPAQVLITTGSQQGLDLLARVYLDEGDAVAVARPTFLGALQTFAGMGALPVEVADDPVEGGMDPQDLDRLLTHHQPKPKLIYVIPTFQNPTGVTWSQARKEAIYEVARRHGVPIVEDDPYGELYFTKTRPTPMRALDPTGEGVMLLRSFSKVLAPGLRVAYAVLPPATFTKVMPPKQSADLHTTGLAQVMIHEYLMEEHLPGHLRRLREVYARRASLMLSAMEQHFPPGCHWTRPEGGLFIWVTLPEGLSAPALLPEAVKQKVAFIPGAPFFAGGGGDRHLRLNFSNAAEDRIEEGIMRLGGVLSKALLATSGA